VTIPIDKLNDLVLYLEMEFLWSIITI